MLQGQLASEPANLPLALRVAGGYLELGRITGDPRYSGYAEGVLAPWWHLDRVPSEVLLVRAMLRHLDLSLMALAVAIAVAVPLGIALTRAPAMAALAVGVANVLRTIPSLALLVLMLPLLGTGYLPAVIHAGLRARNDVSSIRQQLHRRRENSA